MKRATTNHNYSTRVSKGDKLGVVRSASRSLSVRLTTSSCREETYLGVSHLVVPVIPIYGNLVFWPTGAEGYEFVPDYVVAAAPVGWNNRPVVPIHPDISQPTANTPAFLEMYSFGQLFNTSYGTGIGTGTSVGGSGDGKLHTEAWLNRSRAEKVGSLALDVIKQCESGSIVEVSIGAQISFESRAGSYNGKDFIGIWRSLVPDHLAMGLAGQVGACSIADGCGGNRLAGSNVESKPINKKSKSIYVSSSNSLSARRAKGAQPVAIPNIKELMTTLLNSIRLSGTPAEDAEEAAELISYSTMRDLISSSITQLQAAQTEVLALISAETESPTETAESESAEETIEIAQFGRIRSLLYASADTIYSAASIVYDLSRSHIAAKELEEAAEGGDGVVPVVIVGDTRYYADGNPMNANGSRSAKGARHSKEDMKMIQKTHDATVSLGATCAADNAETGETKTAAASAASAASIDVSTVNPCGCHTPASLF